MCFRKRQELISCNQYLENCMTKRASIRVLIEKVETEVIPGMVRR
ncbi:hypothetical protein SAMN02910342_03271 [Butyrivibrio sp. INlla21]|nr:hypothetical protein SAMN02910342_03271 [Butyrivibrio sp. INlla21]